jgi:Flp pilus assembly protein TadG
MERLKNQKGIAAVEFALVLPLLVILAFGIIEFSLVLFDKAVITNASREGARAAIVYRVTPATEVEIQGVVNTYCQNRLISLKATNPPAVLVSPAGASGDPRTVRVTYRYNFLVIPAFIASLGQGIELQAETIMRME